MGWVVVAKANYQVIVSNGANPNFISLLIVHPSRLDGFFIILAVQHQWP